MSAANGISAAGSGILNYSKALTPQAQEAAAKLKAGRQDASRAPTNGAGNPVDTIETSPQANAVLANLSLLNQEASEEQKDQDAKDLKAATDKLHLLQILGASLPPEKLAKEVTDLAKQIAGIAADYAANSPPTTSAATPATSAASGATSAADDAATAATTAASTASPAGDATNSAESSAGKAQQAAAAAAKAAKPSADQAASATGTAAANAGQASQPATPPAAASAGAAGTGASTGSATPGTAPGASTGAPADQDQTTADAFFAQVIGDFKDLKKLETRALSQLSASTDPKKKEEAKKLGGEFNDAVNSVKQSAAAAGVPEPDINQLSIDVSKVTFSITA